MARKHFKILNESEFNLIKNALNNGMKRSEVSRLSGRSDSTIGNIRVTNSFQEYLELQRQYRQGLKKQNKPVRVQEQVTETNYRINNLSELKEVINELHEINNNLSKLIVAWESKPKGIFR